MLLMRNANVPNIGAFDILVSPKGSDSTGTGKLNNPYKTIQKGLNMASAGKTVFAFPGLYPENLTIPTSGSSGNPLTVKGSRGANTVDYLTVIDASTDASTGWVEDTGVGAGVYKKSLGFEPGEMAVGGKRIGKLRNDIMGVGGDGWTYLALSPTAEVDVLDTSLKVVFWDGIEAICAYDSASGYSYIRFRNRDNPNSMPVTVATTGSGIYMDDKSYITIQDLQIQQNEYQIQMRDLSHNNIIEDNLLIGGRARIYTFGGLNNLVIRRNEMTMNYYAGDEYLGAGGFANYTLLVKRHVYDTFKYLFGPNLSDDMGFYFRNIGQNISVHDNYIHGGLIGLTGYNGDYGYSSPANGVYFYNNFIHNMGSLGITSSRNVQNMEIYNNLIFDANLCIRMHELNRSDEYARSVRIYSNVAWNPADAGVLVYLHFPYAALASYFPTYHIYNNIFVNGHDGFNAGDYASSSGGLPNTHIFNNFILTISPMLSAFRQVIIGNKIALIDSNAIGNTTYTGLGDSFGANNEYFLNSTYGYLNYTSLENFLANFNRASYNVTWLDRATVYPTLPFSETTWL